VALVELLEALREQAGERRAAELSRAEASAKRIRDESRVALARRREEYLTRVRLEEEEMARRSLARARSEGERNVLSARAHFLERVRAELLERVRAADADPLYLEVLPSEIEGALARLPAGHVKVVCAPALLPHVLTAVAGKPDVSCEADGSSGAGFRAVSLAEPVEVDGELSAMLDLAWPRLAVAVLEEVSG
jgi:vacuolar-type H+-ATPase subunit E/Vma4